MTTEKVLKALGQAARNAREAAEVKREEIAIRGNCGYDTVGRFERGNTWPQRPGELLAAYEALAGVTEEELWREAMGTVIPAAAPTSDDDDQDRDDDLAKARQALDHDQQSDEVQREHRQARETGTG